MPSESTALAKATPGAGLPDKPLAKIEDLRDAFADLKTRANIVSPIASVDHIMPMHQISLRAVLIDPKVDQYGAGPECYRDPRFCKGDEVALGKNALSKLMAAAGVQVMQKTRLDDRSDPNYCEIEVVLAVRDYDGTYRQVVATKEMDLRPGAPETMKPEKDGTGRKTGKLVPFEDTAIADKRRHIQSHAETKAIERGLRLLFSLKQKYTLAELEKPFVVPKLVANLDPDDPETKTALIHHALGGEAALYGQPRGAHGTRVMRAIEAHGRANDPSFRALPPADPDPVPDGVDPETGEVVEETVEDFDAPPPAPAAVPIVVCECPCGCQAEVSEATAKATKERKGTVRCRACWPGSGFDFARHKDLKDLAFPGMQLTPEAARDLARKAGAR